MKKIIIIGAGGHAKSVMDIAIQNKKYEIIGCIDACYDENKVSNVNGIPIIGNDDMLEYFRKTGIEYCFIAIGNNNLREKLFNITKEIGFKHVNIISKHAILSSAVTLGKGICIMAGAIINTNAVIKDNCIINTNCSIDHDCYIGENTHIAPGVTLSGSVVVEKNVQIGTGACVIDGMCIKHGAYIGAGSVVVNDINEGVLAYGIPAKEIRKL